MTDFKAARPAGCRPRRRTPTTRLLPRDDEVHPDDERAQQAAHDYPEGAQFHSPDSQGRSAGNWREGLCGFKRIFTSSWRLATVTG
jgi:hypothetical protein